MTPDLTPGLPRVPRIVFCITCKNRTQHLKLTLPQNLRDNAHYRPVKFVLLNYGSTDDLMPYLRQTHAEAIEHGRLVVYTHPYAGAFRMAHAKNLAHRLGIIEGAEILVNLDADNFTGPAFTQYITQAFARRRDQFLWGRMIQRCNEPCEEGFCVLPRYHDETHSSHLVHLAQRYPEVEHPLSRGVSGRLVVTVDAFLKVGGYDEYYEDWGPDDKDFNHRLQLLGLTGEEIPRRHLQAIHHSEKLRFKEYPHAQPNEGTYDQPVMACGQTAVVNFGAFGMGTVLRNFSTAAFHLDYLPTRIFGIGLHKTGTTSLHEALQTLGYDSGHWNTPRWARQIWTQLRESGKSLTLERHEALTDLPISILYRQLDLAYPNSKFILTIRDEAEWLASVRTHWSLHNQWRRDWDQDCFSHRMHHEVYGRRSFDPAIFLARYRRHNAEVRAYFRDRPQDLLIMDLNAQPTWAPLCAFLDRPIPATPYPFANGTVHP